ncbi:chorismate synthase [Methanopyrus sp.]
MNTLGRWFRVTTWGESHGRALGAVVDGCPAGLPLSEEDVQRELDRRRPGQSSVSSPRSERDRVEFLSGVFEGRTLGTPISMVVWNEDVDSSRYEPIRTRPRPGHADLTYRWKYGHVDWRGGGRASGRTTVGVVMGGAVARKLLREAPLEEPLGVEIAGHVVRVGSVEVGEVGELSAREIRRRAESNPVRCVDGSVAEEMVGEIERAREEGDSVGGTVEVVAENVPPGLGDPVFGRLDGELAGALMGIPAVKAVEIGSGVECARMRGSEHNDPIVWREGRPVVEGGRCGGVLGGISCGGRLVVRVHVKPTPSVSVPQRTVDLASGEEVELSVEGRHDPCICPRVVPVAEAVVAIVLADAVLRAGYVNPDSVELPAASVEDRWEALRRNVGEG